MADALPVPCTVGLTLKQQRFVEYYCLNGNAAAAAREAGYSHKRAEAAAHIMKKIPAVATAIATYRADVARRAEYTVDKAMTELEQAMKFAKDTENASAFTRAVELRARIAGVLVDRLDARVAVGSFCIVMHGLPAPGVIDG